MTILSDIKGVTISLGEVIDIMDSVNSTIPVIQRSYCWGMEKSKTLTDNLIESYKKDRDKIYPLAMISLHWNEDRGCVEIIDGQQRFTTLRIILEILEYNNILNFEFDRDSKLNISKLSGQITLTDNLLETRRRTNLLDTEILGYDRRLLKEYADNLKHTEDHKAIVNNRNNIVDVLESIEDKEDFKNYLLTKVEFLFNYIKDNPLSEFLGMNKGKVRFRNYDRAKAFIMAKSEGDTVQISKLFSKLSNFAFNPDNKNIMEFISGGGVNLSGINCVEYFLCGDSSIELHGTSINISKLLIKLTNLLKLTEDMGTWNRVDRDSIAKILSIKGYTIMEFFNRNTHISSVNELIDCILINSSTKDLYIFKDIILGVDFSKGKWKFVANNEIIGMGFTGEEHTLMQQYIREFYGLTDVKEVIVNGSMQSFSRF